MLLAVGLTMLYSASYAQSEYDTGYTVSTRYLQKQAACAVIGLVAMFCGVTNCPIASMILSIELFGSQGLLFFALACAIGYLLSGYTGLYSAQKILYSKTKAEYINKDAE